MDALQRVIAVMTKEEVRNFKLWMNSTNASAQRKDVMLFDYMRKSVGAYHEGFILKKLYGASGKNSFYRLRNRLQEDIGYHLALMHFSKNEANKLHLYLSLYNVFSERNRPDLAGFYLRKAEKRAIQSENFELLDVIYAHFVKFSSGWPEVNPEEYIRKRKENTVRLNQIRETDQVLAAVSYRLKVTQNYGKSDTGLLKLLDNTIKEYSNDETIKRSKLFQTKIFRAVSQILIHNHNFTELEKFMRATYSRFESEKWFDKSNHDTRLQMLVYLVNALFKNRKYRESLDFAEELGLQIEAFNNLHYEKYLFFYYNALVINYSQIDISRGIKALEEMEREIKGSRNAYYDFFVLLNKATLLFSQGKTNEAIRNLVRVYANDHYRNTDREFQLKIAVAECMMQCDSGDPSTTNKRVEQVRKKYADLLAAADGAREREVLWFITEISRRDDWKRDKKLLAGAKKFVAAKVSERVEDSEVLRYRGWLKAVFSLA